jgi:hypothetical protein
MFIVELSTFNSPLVTEFKALTRSVGVVARNACAVRVDHSELDAHDRREFCLSEHCCHRRLPV